MKVLKKVKKKTPKDGQKKINLPADTLENLGELADLDNRPVKNYIEKVLIEHAKGNKLYAND